MSHFVGLNANYNANESRDDFDGSGWDDSTMNQSDAGGATNAPTHTQGVSSGFNANMGTNPSAFGARSGASFPPSGFGANASNFGAGASTFGSSAFGTNAFGSPTGLGKIEDVATGASTGTWAGSSLAPRSAFTSAPQQSRGTGAVGGSGNASKLAPSALDALDADLFGAAVPTPTKPAAPPAPVRGNESMSAEEDEYGDGDGYGDEYGDEDDDWGDVDADELPLEGTHGHAHAPKSSAKSPPRQPTQQQQQPLSPNKIQTQVSAPQSKPFGAGATSAFGAFGAGSGAFGAGSGTFAGGGGDAGMGMGMGMSAGPVGFGQGVDARLAPMTVLGTAQPEPQGAVSGANASDFDFDLDESNGDGRARAQAKAGEQAAGTGAAQVMGAGARAGATGRGTGEDTAFAGGRHEGSYDPHNRDNQAGQASREDASAASNEYGQNAYDEGYDQAGDNYYTYDDNEPEIDDSGRASVSTWLRWLGLDAEASEDQPYLKYALRAHACQLREHYAWDPAAGVYVDLRSGRSSLTHPKLRIYAAKLEVARARRGLRSVDVDSDSGSDDDEGAADASVGAGMGADAGEEKDEWSLPAQPQRTLRTAAAVVDDAQGHGAAAQEPDWLESPLPARTLPARGAQTQAARAPTQPQAQGRAVATEEEDWLAPPPTRTLAPPPGSPPRPTHAAHRPAAHGDTRHDKGSAAGTSAGTGAGTGVGTAVVMGGGFRFSTIADESALGDSLAEHEHEYGHEHEHDPYEHGYGYERQSQGARAAVSDRFTRSSEVTAHPPVRTAAATAAAPAPRHGYADQHARAESTATRARARAGSVPREHERGTVRGRGGEAVDGLQLDAERTLLKQQLVAAQADLAHLTSTLTGQLAALHASLETQRAQHAQQLATLASAHRRELDRARVEAEARARQVYQEQIGQMQQAMSLALEQLRARDAAAKDVSSDGDGDARGYEGLHKRLGAASSELQRLQEQWAQAQARREEAAQTAVQERLDQLRLREDKVSMQEAQATREKEVLRGEREAVKEKALELRRKADELRRGQEALAAAERDAALALERATEQLERERERAMAAQQKAEKGLQEREALLSVRERAQVERADECERRASAWEAERLAEQEALELERAAAANALREARLRAEELDRRERALVERERATGAERDAELDVLRARQAEADRLSERTRIEATRLSEQAKLLRDREQALSDSAAALAAQQADFEFEYEEAARVLEVRAAALERERVSVRRERETVGKMRELAIRNGWWDETVNAAYEQRCASTQPQGSDHVHAARPALAYAPHAAPEADHSVPVTHAHRSRPAHVPTSHARPAPEHGDAQAAPAPVPPPPGTAVAVGPLVGRTPDRPVAPYATGPSRGAASPQQPAAHMAPLPAPLPPCGCGQVPCVCQAAEAALALIRSRRDAALRTLAGRVHLDPHALVDLDHAYGRDSHTEVNALALGTHTPIPAAGSPPSRVYPSLEAARVAYR